MLDLSHIEGFEWDDSNGRKSENKHAVSQGEAEQVFLGAPLLILEDEAHSEVEPRYHAMGKTEGGRLLHITFAVRGNGKKIRVISARDMHRKERAAYAKGSETGS